MWCVVGLLTCVLRVVCGVLLNVRCVVVVPSCECVVVFVVMCCR